MTEPPRSLERRYPSALVVFAAVWLIEAALEHVAVEWWIRRQLRDLDRPPLACGDRSPQFRIACTLPREHSGEHQGEGFSWLGRRDASSVNVDEDGDDGR